MLKYTKYLIFTLILTVVFLFSQNINSFSNILYTDKLVDRLEKHWWGYRRYISNEQVQRLSDEFDFIAAELGFASGISIPISFLNPMAGIFVSSILELSSSYCWLLSTYISKVNKGNGIIIDFSNGIIFRIVGI